MKDLEDLVESLSKMCFGKSLSEAHKKKTCIQCGEKVGNFSDDDSRMEYEISGLCSKCQKDYFE